MATKRYRNGWPIMGSPVPPSRSSYDEMLAFNKQLAAPSDQIPKASYAGAGNAGWQTGNPSAILAQYGTPGQGMMASYGGFPVGYSPSPRPSTAAGFPVAGATGPAGVTGDEQPITPPATSPSGRPDGPSAIPPAPAQNAMQRQQAEAEQASNGMPPMSPQKRYYWATGRIDGRATQSPRNALTDWDETFGAGATPMGSAPMTWAARQATNQQKISNVRQQRGLDDWTPY